MPKINEARQQQQQENARLKKVLLSIVESEESTTQEKIDAARLFLFGFRKVGKRAKIGVEKILIKNPPTKILEPKEKETDLFN